MRRRVMCVLDEEMHPVDSQSHSSHGSGDALLGSEAPPACREAISMIEVISMGLTWKGAWHGLCSPLQELQQR